MGLFHRILGKTEVTETDEAPEKEEKELFISAIIGGENNITKKHALQVPTINACISLIADKTAALPIKLYRKSGDKTEEIADDPRVRMLNGDTGDTINATEMRKKWVEDYYLGKGSYTYIRRDVYARIIGLYYVDESRIAAIPNNDPIYKEYSINCNGNVYAPSDFLKIFRRTDGKGKGTSIIDEASTAIATAYNTIVFENTLVRKGGSKKGFLQAENKVGDEALEKIKAAWRKMYSNTQDTSDNVVVLNNGIKFQEASSSNVELQLNENKLTNANEMCKLFCLPDDILSRNASEATQSQAVKNCYVPLINTIEAALDSDLLYEHEKADHYFAFDTTELMRGDFASRMNGYATALQNNIFQLDEVRAREDLPPLGFNYIKLGLQDVLLDPVSKEIYTPNTKEMVNLENGEIKKESGNG